MESEFLKLMRVRDVINGSLFELGAELRQSTVHLIVLRLAEGMVHAGLYLELRASVVIVE